MDWVALWLSIKLGLVTLAVLLPVGLLVGRWLAYAQFAGKGFVEAAFALPLVLPPTVVGYYLLVGVGGATPIGQVWRATFGHNLVFSFEGLVFASVIVNLPFAIQPMQRAFEAIAPNIREAAAVSGLSPWQVHWRVELPLAWQGVVMGLVLTFAHTLGEFGVVLMVGGSIPGETKTVAIAIYDRVQAFDTHSAGVMAAVLLAMSLVTLGMTYRLSASIGRRHV